MNVARVYIPLMNSALHVQRVELPQEKEGLSFGRRVRTIWEIEDFDQYREVAVWNPRSDTFETWFEDSILLERIAVGSGRSKQDLLSELEARTKYLTEIISEGIRDQKEVAEKILSYYSSKREEKETGKKKKKVKKKQDQPQEPESADDSLTKEDELDLDFSSLPELTGQSTVVPQDGAPAEESS